MTLDEAIEAARQAWPRARSSPGLRAWTAPPASASGTSCSHGGDHSVHMEKLVDIDLEDGERGPDMRDFGHRRPVTAALWPYEQCSIPIDGGILRRFHGGVMPLAERLGFCAVRLVLPNVGRCPYVVTHSPRPAIPAWPTKRKKE